MFMPYAGGLNTYTEICRQVAAKDYEAFIIRQGDRVLSDSLVFTSHPPMPDIPAKLLPIIVERLTAAGLMPAARTAPQAKPLAWDRGRPVRSCSASTPLTQSKSAAHRQRRYSSGE
jgi:hypothetical protein